METNSKFSKNQKLKSKKAIDLLFKNGQSISSPPIHAIYLLKKELNGVSINMAVSVPKKNIKLAVNRNLIKRRIREAYRINNSELKKSLLEKEIEINLMLIYTAKQILDYKEIEDKIKVILTRLIDLSEVVSE